MASISWKNNASGNYDTAANWSSGTVPGARDDVTISTSTAATITKSNAASDKALSFYLGGADTLAITGGSIQIIGSATVYGTLTESAGTFTTGGANSFIYGNVTQTGGTISANTGVLNFTGTDSFAGTLKGATLAFAGNETIQAGAVVNSAHIQVTGGTFNLGENLASGGWTQTGGDLGLGTSTLALTGATNFDGGFSTGAGAITLAGATELDGYAFEGSTTITNSGTVDQTGYIYVGYNAGDTVKLVNAASGTYRIDGNQQIYGPGGSSFNNAGAMVKSGGGASAINVNFVDTGSIAVTSGDLRLDGTVNSIAGTVSGAGTIELNAGTTTLATGSALTVKNVLLDGGTLALGAALTYAGNWNQSGGTLALGGKVLTLSGAVALDGGAASGPGTVAVAVGATAEIGSYYLLGSTAFKNSGVLTQTGYLYVGYNSGDTATFTNAAGAVWNIAANNSVYGIAGALVSNAGTLNKSGGAGISAINDSFTNTGTINIAAGALRLDGSTNSLKGTISGAGTLQLDAGNTTIGPATVTVAHMLLDGGVMTLGSNLTDGKDWQQTGGTLALNAHTLTLATTEEFDGGVASGTGTIAVKNGVISGYELTGAAVLSNTGTLTQTGYLYVGYNSGDTAQLINAAGATYKILGNNAIYGVGGALITNNGVLAKSGGAGTAVINDSFNSTAGTSTISITAGTLRFDGAVNNFGGTISGAGTMEMNAGTDTIAGNTVATVSAMLFDGANVSVGTGLSYAGVVSVTAGTIQLNNGSGLTLSGSVNFDGGVLNGTGTLSLSSASEFYGFALEGSALIKNSGTLNQQGSWYLGYNSGDTSQLQNQAGGVINIYNNTSIYSVGGAKLTNAGTIDKYGSGTAVIGAPLVDTGTISVAAGYLRLSGATSTLGGTITGAGSLELNTGTDTISAGTTLSIGGIYADGATVVMSGAETYAGRLSLTSGTLNLGAPTFTLSGTGNFEGGVVIGSGTLALAGRTTIAGLVVEGSETVSNTGSMTQVGNWYVGYNSGDAIKFVNQASGALQITAGSQIYGTAGSSFTNAGLVSKTGAGASQVAVATINTGTVNVASGTMSFGAAVSGAGTFTMGTGTTLSFAGAVAAGGHVSMGADATLNANTTAGFGDAIANFTGGDVISLNGLGYSSNASFTFNTSTDKLVVTSGSSSATLLFSGSYTSANFVLFNNGGTTGVAHS